jgi:hypothetical protein
LRVPLPAALAAILSLALTVQASAVEADAADAPVPRPVYRSAFSTPPASVTEDPIDWRQANREVAAFPRGHADILKWEKAQSPAKQVPEKPAAPPHEHPQ